MNECQRERLLERVDDLSGNVGGAIPEKITVQGTEVNLKEFVFEVKRLEEIPDEERERVEEMKLALKRERLSRKHRIERDDIAYEEGERLVRSIEGIERALNALEGLDAPSIGEQMRRQKLETARQIMSMVDLKTRLER